ncbi:MAG: hypothetical protein KQH67_03010 [Bacteroidetes bacterium]|nr:hypothetical protein [Bacteroidota bacterium]
MLYTLNNNEFIGLIAQYNQAMYPLQILLFILGLLAVILTHLMQYKKNTYTAIILGILWIYSGLIYFFMYLPQHSQMSYFYGSLFMLQGLFLFYEAFFRNKLSFGFQKSAKDITAYIIILTGLLIYPLVTIASGHHIPEIMTLGLPGPTVIFTLGFLMLGTNRNPLYLVLIPSLWGLVGFTLSLSAGVYVDGLTLISAIITVSWLLTIKKYNKVKKAPLE